MANAVYSMTGFGRAEVQEGGRKLTAELKSVNHRYLDFNIKLPRKLTVFEPEVRRILKDYAKRGKLDVCISYEDDADTAVDLKYNEAIAGQYVKYAEQIERQFGIPNDLSVSRLLEFPDVITEEDRQIDEESLWKDLEKVIREAGESFKSARQTEGENLRSDLMKKLAHLDDLVDDVIVREPKIVAEYRERLEEKTKELLADSTLDDSRIAAEVVLYADKISTDEETVRLKSHIQNMRDTLDLGDNIGRKLDFLAQEMNREANTILSKANDLETSNIGVELKTEIEKIREQVQNIE